MTRIFLGAVVLLPLAMNASAPGWWTDRGVIDLAKTANDFAAVNQGQLKNVARQALVEMDASFASANLPVAPTDALHALVNGWSQPNASANNYAAVNLGQLKSVAALFYDRFKAVAYTDRYPWTNSPAPANDFALANIGQVKNLFSFDFTLPGAGLDLDHNGLPDYWEMKYFGHTGVDPDAPLAWNSALTNWQAFEQGLNPNDFYNGHAPRLSKASGDAQHGAPGELVPLPLLVSVIDADQHPLIGAPVTFTVSQGGGRLQKSSSAAPAASITVLTDYQGRAKAFFKLSAQAGDANQITATPGSGSYPVTSETPIFNESADAAPGGNSSPFDPTNVTATLNADGSMDVTWTSNADPGDQTPISIQDFDANGVYHTIATAPAGATSFHIPAP